MSPVYNPHIHCQSSDWKSDIRLLRAGTNVGIRYEINKLFFIPLRVTIPCGSPYAWQVETVQQTVLIILEQNKKYRYTVIKSVITKEKQNTVYGG